MVVVICVHTHVSVSVCARGTLGLRFMHNAHMMETDIVFFDEYVESIGSPVVEVVVTMSRKPLRIYAHESAQLTTTGHRLG